MIARRRTSGEGLAVVGTSVKRVDALAKVTGAARFTPDITLPGMLHAALVRSPELAGTIEAIDFSAALALSGVHGAIRAEDLVKAPIDCAATHFGPLLRDQPILGGPEVRYVGEPVAAVFAEDPRLACEAAELVDVRVRRRAGAASLDEALAPGAPLVHGSASDSGEFAEWSSPPPPDSNICHMHTETSGDVAREMERADRIFEEEYVFPSVYHYAMEPHCAIAEANRDGVTAWSSAQHPHLVAQDLARLFDYPLSAVRVIATYVGGGFGSKSFSHIEPLATALSLAAGRPVKLALNVSEAMRVSRRHSARMKVRTGIDNDLQLRAIELELFYDTGAYALAGPLVAAKGCTRALGGYRLPAYRARAHAVYVNTSPAGSFRSIGGPQAAWGVEAQLNHIAVEMGADPLELRRANVAEAGSAFRAGRRVMDADLRHNLDVLAKQSAAIEPDRFGVREGKVGMGVSLGVTDPAARATSTAIVKVGSDGSTTLLLGSSELGQGVRTVAAQIVAEELGVDISTVRVQQTDTGSGVYDTSTGASRSTTMGGAAVQRAAADVRRRILQLAAEQHGLDEQALSIEHGVIRGREATVEIGAVVRGYFGRNGGVLIGTGAVTEHEFTESPPFWEIAGGAATVVVDPELGEVRLLGYSGVSDMGKVINPAMTAGQEYGAIVQGFGHTLYEQLVWEAGEPLVTSLVDYRVPRFGDLPDVFVVGSVEDGNGPGPFGAKGGGEGSIVPVAAAIAGAVEDATGIRFYRLPMTPEEVWRSIAASRRDNEHDPATVT